MTAWKVMMRKIVAIAQKMKIVLLGLLMLALGRSDGQGPAQPKILKISVLASGTVLLDGKQIGMKDLEVALNQAGSSGGAVLYYREAAAEEPPPQAKEVISLIAKNRLPVRLCTKADFSDYVDEAGVSRSMVPAKNDPAQFNPKMPDVQAVPDIEEVFADARKRAAGNNPHAVIIVLPDRRRLVFPAGQPASTAAAAAVERMIPSLIKRNIAAIGSTGFLPEISDTTRAGEINKAIPFFGMLIGLSSIGHSVWIFEGHANAIAAGCRDADLLIVDSGMVPFLPQGWEDEAAKVMRNPNIMIHDRATFQLLIVKKVGESDRLEFRD